MYCSESFYQAEEGWDFGKESRMPRGEAGSITGFCLAIGKVGGKEGCAFRYPFFEFILGFWACLQTGVNVILLVPGTNPFRSMYQTIDSPSVPTM